MSTRETQETHTEYGVRRPDGKIISFSGRGSQAQYDAYQHREHLNARAHDLGVLDYRAEVVRRKVRVRKVITTTREPWETA